MTILPYVYKITNKTTNEFYIGSRYKNVKANRSAKDDLFIFYFTSSKMKIQMKENPKDFYCQILFEFIDYDICFWYEQILIKESIKNEKCINGQYVDPDKNNKIFSHSGSVEVRNKISKANTGKIRTAEVKEKLRKIHSTRPRQLQTEETKLKIAKTLTGRTRSKEDCYHKIWITPFGEFESLKESRLALNYDIYGLCSIPNKLITNRIIKSLNVDSNMLGKTAVQAGFTSKII